ncbi:hypothetical protein A5692_19360 [Mycobacterium sp. E342]|uniref:hypothetical protein n=1 Tax=Mycobacterium sp. E342 TaxID=1834147 RepID=UPI0007FBE3D0|nr:hypothetical protein [Mycobacterium sp. E342]OBH30292.1 hypothetical protein A5692_19360 [Mycobacterium sp. E342]
MSNVLDLADQTMFLGERATATTSVLQCIWVYDRPVDVDGLRRFHRHLGRGRLRRRIERSPLPFGRHRWVAPTGQSELEMVAAPRAREAIGGWLDEQADKRPDAEHGPGYHLAVLPLTDGGAAVSLVTTHCLTDGVGLCEALADAACGRDDAIDWPAPAARRRWRAMREDARQTVRDTADMGRAVVAAIRLAGTARHAGAATSPAGKRPAPPAGADERITLPMATLFINADEWDARAEALGGTSNALLAGLAAHLARRVGRVGADGTVNVGMPVNERTPGDTRANAVVNVDITVDPAPATTDLREIRARVKEALARHLDEPDERWALLPLVPLIPKRVMRRLIGVVTGSAITVVSSNLGTLDPAVNRPDGTDADHFAMRTVYPGVTTATMYRTNGALALLSGRVHGRVFVSFLAYELGRHNSIEQLRDNVSSALSDFGLTGSTAWRTVCPA